MKNYLMHRRPSRHPALLLCGLLFLVLLCTLGGITVTIGYASMQPNAQTRLLLPHEWEFSELDGDGETSVEIVKKYGFIEVSTTHPR